MKFFRHVGLGAAFAGLLSCSGTFEVGHEAARAGSPNANAGAANVENANAGGASPLAASGGSAAIDLRAGAFPSDNPSGKPVFCGNELPAAQRVNFAPPAVVYRRVLKFLYDNDPVVPEDLPSETTREWAGSLAAAALDSVSTPSAQGMNRFLRSWWPGSPNPEVWAAYFSSKRGTLVDLLTTDSQLAKGAGLLTDPSVLVEDSISKRGTTIYQNLLCVDVPREPDDTKSAPLMPGQTRRALLEALVANQPCAACHKLVDPPGIPLQNFAPDGSYRTTENDLPLNTSTVLEFANSGDFPVSNPQTLGSAFANSCEVATCVTQQLLHDATVSAALPRAASTPEVAAIAAQFTQRGLSLPDLVRLVVESDAFLRAD